LPSTPAIRPGFGRGALRKHFDGYAAANSIVPSSVGVCSGLGSVVGTVVAVVVVSATTVEATVEVSSG
jgi:hypothetical protein